MPWHSCERQRTICHRQFSSSTMWNKLKQLGLAVGTVKPAEPSADADQSKLPPGSSTVGAPCPHQTTAYHSTLDSIPSLHFTLYFETVLLKQPRLALNSLYNQWSLEHAIPLPQPTKLESQTSIIRPGQCLEFIITLWVSMHGVFCGCYFHFVFLFKRQDLARQSSQSQAPNHPASMPRQHIRWSTG